MARDGVTEREVGGLEERVAVLAGEVDALRGWRDDIEKERGWMRERLMTVAEQQKALAEHVTQLRIVGGRQMAMWSVAAAIGAALLGWMLRVLAP